MRVTLQLVICHDDGQEETVTDVITLNKNNQRIEHLGLSLAESKHLLRTLQRHLLQQQLTAFLALYGIEVVLPGVLRAEPQRAQGLLAD